MTTFVFIHPIWMTALAVSLMGVVFLAIIEFSKNWELRRKDGKDNNN